MLLAQLFQTARAFDMEVQPQLLLLQKNMLMAEGVSRQLDPALNIWSLAEPLIADWMRENRGPEARAREAIDEAITTARRLPAIARRLEGALTDLAEGGLRIHPDSLQAMGGDRGPLGGRSAPWWLVAVLLGLLLVAVLA